MIMIMIIIIIIIIIIRLLTHFMSSTYSEESQVRMVFLRGHPTEYYCTSHHLLYMQRVRVCMCMCNCFVWYLFQQPSHRRWQYRSP